VREIANQLSVGLMLGDPLFLAFDSQALVDGPQFEQQVGLGQIDRRRNAIQVQRFMARPDKKQILVGESALIANHLL
jgi:hypothetical protein